MAQLLSVNQLSHSFSGRTLFTNVQMGIEEGDRIGLVGPNGVGKSTLLKILSRQIEPDSGDVVTRRGLKIGYLEQTPTFNPELTLFDTLYAGVEHDDDGVSKVLEWMSKLGLSDFSDHVVGKLSGGWKKRLALARELIKDPQLLFLDEPTNHLDVEGIMWLEDFLQESNYTYLTITHDRLFLQRVTNKIMDLDPRNPNFLMTMNGSYMEYVANKEMLLAGQKQQELNLKNTLRRETEWLRRGAIARLKKQQARIDRAGSLKEDVERISAKNRTQKIEIEFGETESLPKKLIEAVKLEKTVGEGSHQKTLFTHFNHIIGSKSRIGLLGPNGSGKTTLIKVLLGMEEPTKGYIQRNREIKISYFEQNRDTLDLDRSLLSNICPEGDYVFFLGKPIHVRSYLDRFLFFGNKVDLPVRQLSGGEQSRLRIAQLMLQPANLLILDEPTNDLDVDTLNVLEESLKEFPGAVLLVSHDRYFMDQVSTEILAFDHDSEGHGVIERFADYFQWEDWKNVKENPSKSTKQQMQTEALKSEPTAKLKKLSFKEVHELENMEETILGLESKLQELEKTSQDPDVFSNSQRVQEVYAEMASIQKKTEELYKRWQELEARKNIK